MSWRAHVRDMPRRSLTLVAYDVVDRRRRTRALKIAKAYGLGGQKSVHECGVTRTERRDLVRRLRALLDPKEDRGLIIRLDPRAARRSLGRAKPAEVRPWVYLG